MSDLPHLTKEEQKRVVFAKRNRREPCQVEVIIGWAEALNEARGKLAGSVSREVAEQARDVIELVQRWGTFDYRRHGEIVDKLSAAKAALDEELEGRCHENTTLAH